MIRPILVLAASLSLLLVLTLSGCSPQRQATSSKHDTALSTSAAAVTITVNRAIPDGTSHLSTGITHGQYSLDSWGDPTAVANGKSLLAAATAYQNQHVYGWGATNPEPAPGRHDWTSLDRRIRLMRSMGAGIVITLCCAPDWMTRLGTATSRYPDIPPTPSHYADFAALARRLALRYPDVRYYQVWNDMKGFWDRTRHTWDYVAYTNLYNAVYDALKGVNPAIQVGGPYVVVEGTGSTKGDQATARPITARNWQVINYWLQHKHGADFITFDRSVQDYHDTHGYTPSELLRLTSTFESVAHQIRSVTTLPMWWAEDYFVGGRNGNYQEAGLASILYHELKGGSAVSLSWQPQGIADGPYNGNQQSLFSDTRQPGGGQPFPYYRALQAFHRYFGPGTRLYTTSSSSADLEVLASATTTLLINKRSTRVAIHMDGTSFTLAPYQVMVVGPRRVTHSQRPATTAIGSPARPSALPIQPPHSGTPRSGTDAGRRVRR